MIIEYGFNVEQSRAFRLVAEHAFSNAYTDPLRLFINGLGGTGKSRIINALKDLFERTHQSRHFRLASYTGIAARNIAGMTLHSSLALGCKTKSKTSNAHQELVAMWDRVDYLFINEVSMLSCGILSQINAALNAAKGVEGDTKFGRVFIIFAEDFAQLPPVTGKHLYTNINTDNWEAAAQMYGQNNIAGRLLWKSVMSVVTLTQIMRQSGFENDRFVQLLGRLRRGCCTMSDYELLNTCLLENASGVLADGTWRGAPIVVTNNTTKDALNYEAVRAYARSVGRTWHWYYSTDYCNGHVVSDNGLQAKLDNQHSGLCKQRLSRIPLVVGMRVIICQNFDVEHRVVNGSIGELQRIRYIQDDDGRRHLTSCVVHIDDVDRDSLPHLEAEEVAVL